MHASTRNTHWFRLSLLDTQAMYHLMAKLDPAHEWLWHGWSHSSFWEREASGRVKDLPSTIAPTALLSQDFQRFFQSKGSNRSPCPPLLMQRFRKSPSINYLAINLNLPRQNMIKYGGYTDCSVQVFPQPFSKGTRKDQKIGTFQQDPVGSATVVPQDL